MRNADDLAQNAEVMGKIAGRMHGAVEAFGQRTAEVVAQLRLNTNEQRAEGTKALEYLQEIAKYAQGLQSVQQNFIRQTQHQLPERFDAVARAAGEAQARAFGESILNGMQQALADASKRAEQAARQLERAARALHWKTAGMFAAAALGFSLIVSLYLWALNASARSQLEALRAEQAELSQTVQLLKDAGGELDIAYCGPSDKRLCVRVHSERLGPRKDYAPVYLLKEKR